MRRNALIADLLHRIDFIEKAGTGIKRIRDEAHDGGYPAPIWQANGFVTTVFRPNPEVRAAVEESLRTADGSEPAQSGAQWAQVLAALRLEAHSAADLAGALSLRSKTGTLKRTLGELVARGLVQYTLPDKRTSRLQRYRLTTKGRRFLKMNKPTAR